MILLTGLAAMPSVVAAHPSISGADLSRTIENEKTVVLSVPNMTCPVCPITVKESLNNTHGVNKVSVHLKERTATVNFDPQKTSLKMLIKATANVGYPSTIKTSKKVE